MYEKFRITEEQLRRIALENRTKKLRNKVVYRTEH